MEPVAKSETSDLSLVPKSELSNDGVPVAATETAAKKRKKRKGTMKLKKAPGAPRRFKTAFIFFSTAKHKELREALGKRASKEKTTNIAKMVSTAWKNLSKEERAVWDSIAAKDKARYELEKSMYDGPWQVAVGNGRDPDAPRRPCSSFVTYLNHKRDEVKKAHPNASSIEIMRIVSKIWQESPEDRAHFLQREAEERRQYKKDMEKWNERQKKKPEVVMATKREEMAWMALEAQEKEEANYIEKKAEHQQEQKDQRDDIDEEIEDVEENQIPKKMPNIQRRDAGARARKKASGASRPTRRVGGKPRNTGETSSPIYPTQAPTPQPDLTLSRDRDTISQRLPCIDQERRVALPSMAAPSTTVVRHLLLGSQDSLRTAYSRALQPQDLLQHLTSDPLRSAVRLPTSVVVNPMDVKLGLLLQQQRMERDLLALSLLDRYDQPLI